MNKEDQNQQDQEFLEGKVEGLAKKLQPLARLFIGMSETGYIDSEVMEECKKNLLEVAAGEQD
ncbi:hypothetical protein SB767_30805, partial [Bacillus sp. SIMBA_069]